MTIELSAFDKSTSLWDITPGRAHVRRLFTQIKSSSDEPWLHVYTSEPWLSIFVRRMQGKGKDLDGTYSTTCRPAKGVYFAADPPLSSTVRFTSPVRTTRWNVALVYLSRRTARFLKVVKISRMPRLPWDSTRSPIVSEGKKIKSAIAKVQTSPAMTIRSWRFESKTTTPVMRVVDLVLEILWCLCW